MTVIEFFGPKGGQGVTVTACSTALLLAKSGPTVIIDLGGDVPATLGIAQPYGPGMTDWPGSGPRASTLTVAAADNLRVLPQGAVVEPEGMFRRLLIALDQLVDEQFHVVIDHGDGRRPLNTHVDATLIVIRPCYLALRRTVMSTAQCSGAVVIREPGRALTTRDVEAALGVPALVELDIDPAVARCVDAGLLAARLPRTMIGLSHLFAFGGV